MKAQAAQGDTQAAAPAPSGRSQAAAKKRGVAAFTAGIIAG
jgi:hypothetical protein